MNLSASKYLLLNLLVIVQCSLNLVHGGSVKTDVFGFTNFVPKEVYTKYRLDKITVLIFLDNKIDENFLKYAHDNKVRTYLTGRYPIDKLGDERFKNNWFKNISSNLIDYKMHGLNLDFDDPISKNDTKRSQLTELVQFLRQQLSDQHVEFSFSVPWSPINKADTATNGQDYDYVEIVKNVDYLLVKSFHVNSQIFVNTSDYDDEVCLAKSNQGFVESAAGLLKWLTINDTDSSKKFNSKDLLDYFPNDLSYGLDEELNLRTKIILVYPWFGLDYTCTARVERQRCLIQPAENFDANCSDKIAKEVSYDQIMKLVKDKKLEFNYDPHSRSTYLEFKDENEHIHQLWFDYYYDYTLKYSYVNQFNLKGMGVYRLDYLNYTNEVVVDSMWNLIPKYKKV